jgi:hypothetical protein
MRDSRPSRTRQQKTPSTRRAQLAGQDHVVAGPQVIRPIRQAGAAVPELACCGPALLRCCVETVELIV